MARVVLRQARQIPKTRKVPNQAPMRWRFFTSSWGTRIAKRKTIRRRFMTYQDMAKLGPDAQKRAEMLLIDTYRESRDLDRAIAETKKALDASPKDREPDCNPGHAVRREIRHRRSDEAAGRIAARQRQRPGNLLEPRASAGTRQEIRGSRAVGAEGRADGARQRRQRNRRGSCWAQFTSGRRNSIRRSRNSAKCWT